MKLFLAILLIFLTSQVNLFSQNLNTLKEKNGFKKYILGSDIRQYTDVAAMEPRVFGSDTMDHLYVGLDIIKIGEAKISDIYFQTVDNKICQILIMFDFSYFNRYDVLSLLEAAFGKVDKQDKRNDAGFINRHWSIDGIHLWYSYKNTEPDRRHILLYTSQELLNLYWEKEKIKNDARNKEYIRDAVKKF